MTGYNTVLQIRKLEDKIEKMGFRMGNSKYPRYNEYGTTIGLMPKDDKLPIYSRDAELFSGTIEEAEIWLRGVEFATEYLKMIKLVTDEKIKRKEQDMRNSQLAQMIKES